MPLGHLGTISEQPRRCRELLGARLIVVLAVEQWGSSAEHFSVYFPASGLDEGIDLTVGTFLAPRCPPAVLARLWIK